jgi:predicted RNase H-like HicB family nuclease
VKYVIVIEKADSNYGAYAPDLPGCIATGDTVEEVTRLMREGIAFHVEGMVEDGQPVPEPTTEVAYAEVSVGGARHD